MSVEIKFSKLYEEQLQIVEDFIYSSPNKNISLVEKFIDEHENVLLFIKENSNTPAIHPITGDQSWPFANGRYRLFFKAIKNNSGNVTIFMLSLIDNRMSNLSIYPGNSLPTYIDE